MTIRHPLYWIYGLTLITAATWAESRGFTMGSLIESKASPRSIRDNPGGGRPIYGSSPRYSGGK
jgi:hypothetical protein